MQTTICEGCGETGLNAKQMPHSSVHCMWPSPSQITNQLMYALCATAQNSQKVATTPCAHMLSATHASLTAMQPKTALTRIVRTSTVDVDWLNILFSKCESIVEAHVSVPAISLRTDGIVRPITDWDQLQHKFTLKRKSTHGSTIRSLHFQTRRKIASTLKSCVA